jgi:Kef-type K+ transport system membrane component KefB/mannitol/fructose-specific phosphotransferase system IIA component (Ntr-type)
MSRYRALPYAFLSACAVPSLLLAADPHAATAAPGGGDMTHRMMMLAIQLGIILVVARIGNMLFEKIKLPGVLGELAAGILIGPFLLGGIALPGFAHGIFPTFSASFPVSPELYGLCSIASIVLLFMVGLETNIKLFLRYSGPGFLVGLGGVIVSFLAGDVLGVLLLPKLMPGTYSMLHPACIFLGIMSTATSVGITARTLSEKRKLDSPEGVTILAGAVIDDVLGIVMLAIGLGIISATKDGAGVDWGHIGVITLKAIGIWLGATVLGLVASRRISALLKHFKDRSSIAIMALGLALILAGLFEEAKLAMIIGAYVMGLSLSRTDISHVIQDNLHPVYKLLVPVFFTVMGMLVDVRLLMDPRVLAFGFIYTLLAIAAKIIGCGLPSLACNFNLRGALRIGVGMLPRGEVALIIAGIGLAAGLLSPEVFGIGILMTLVTTLVAPPVLVMLFSSSNSGLRHPVSHSESKPIVFRFPTEDTAELLTSKLLQAFEDEGFFVHSLDHSSKLYQLLKDNITIRFNHAGCDIVFDCDPAQHTFVSTAMIEVLAEFERTISELRRPLDAGSIVRNAATETAVPAVASPRTALATAINRNLLIPEFRASTKEGVIDELLERLEHEGLLASAAQAREDVLARERSMSTGMQDGIAIPHARTAAVKRLVCAIGLKRQGIAFDSLDGKPTTIVVLTLSPRDAATPHIQFMASISKSLDASGRQTLLNCHNADEMYQFFANKH